MGIAVGTWVAPTIRAIDDLQIQPVSPVFQFGVVVADNGATNDVLFGNGQLAAAVDSSSFDRLEFFDFFPDWSGKLVRPAGCTSPEYTGMVVGVYSRLGTGVTGDFLTVALLSGKGYYEIRATEIVEVD